MYVIIVIVLIVSFRSHTKGFYFSCAEWSNWRCCTEVSCTETIYCFEKKPTRNKLCLRGKYQLKLLNNTIS